MFVSVRSKQDHAGPCVCIGKREGRVQELTWMASGTPEYVWLRSHGFFSGFHAKEVMTNLHLLLDSGRSYDSFIRCSAQSRGQRALTLFPSCTSQGFKAFLPQVRSVHCHVIVLFHPNAYNFTFI